MQSNRERMRDIFDEARRLTGSERAACLDRLAQSEPSLRAQIEDMLAALEEAGPFLSEPTQRYGESLPTVDSAAAQTVVAALREGPGTRIGPYKILQLIGEGGFGSVFMAEQEKPVSRRVALKIIKLGMDTRQVVARFEQERQALAMMDHPNIAKVLDAGATDTGRPFFVMELVKGDPIVDYCDKNNLSIDDRLELFAQVCNAVQHAHTKGIIHRDIKPSNVLVSTQDGRPHTKVIDFGIAKATASKLTEKTLFTEHRQLIGTPEYMSPEQAEGSLDIDTRTDVYSLGVLLYELLTGTTPFSSQELRSAAYAEIQRIIREVEPPKPSTRISNNTDTIASIATKRHTEPKRLGILIRGELDWIVMKALEKDRQRRYETANGLGMDIKRYLSGEAVLAAPPSTSYRFKKFIRRNKGPALAASAVAAVLVLGLAGTGMALKRALDAESELTAQLEVTQKSQRAEAEQRARADERADQLKKVSDFQSRMLGQIDTTAAGDELMKDVRERFAAALDKAGAPEAQREAQAKTFGDLLVRVNATDTAAAMIDRTILRPAIKAIGEQFKDDPATDASLRQALTELYRAIGLPDAAFPLAESALRTRRRVLGENHPDTLTSINSMGSVLRDQGKLAEAEPFSREALEKRRLVLGAEHPETLTSINSMGLLLQAQGKFTEAEPYYLEAVETSRRVLGAQHPETLISINNMAFLLYAQNKLAEAEPHWREVLETSRRLLGEEHPDTLISINNLGALLQAQGKLEEAESLFREALEKRLRVQGEEHPDTIGAIANMGTLLKAQGKLEEAESLYREALEKRRRVLGNDHPSTLISINNMGFFYYNQNKLAQAETYLREALEMRRRTLGEEHPDTLTSINNMGALLRAQGKLAQAEPYLLEEVEKSRRVLGKDHPETINAIVNTGILFREQGKLAQAEPYYREVLASNRATLPAGHEKIAVALSNLAGVQQGLGETAQARAGWDEAIALLRESSPNGSAQLARILWRSGTARLENKDLAAALTELEEAVTMAEKVLPPPSPPAADHPHLKEYRETLAKCKAAMADQVTVEGK